MVVEISMRKIQASSIDLNSGKPRYTESFKLERRKYGPEQLMTSSKAYQSPVTVNVFFQVWGI